MTQALYFDGRTARLHRVELDIAAGAFALSGDGIAKVYPTAQARLAEPFDAAPDVICFSDGTRCEVDRTERQILADALGYRKPRVVRLQEKWPTVMAALVLLIALIGAVAVYGVPAAAEIIAARMPATVDASLGRSALLSLEAKEILLPTRFSEEREEQLQQVFENISPAHPRNPLRLIVRSSKALGANALALPDGTIVLTDEMVLFILGDAADFGEDQLAQLSGVLAHEIGHIEHRHAARVMTRTSLTAALSASLLGDFSAVAAGVPAVLANMEYSRAMESEADDYAIKALRQRRLPLAPLAGLFKRLDNTPQAREAHAVPRWMARSLSYASSHPATEERIARLLKAAGQ
jgi:Zn-dependent protease with chaperone function